MSNGVFQPSEGSDEIAKTEAQRLASGSALKDEGERREHSRHQAFRDHVNRATLFLFWLLVVAVAIGIACFAFHLVFPESWHYLSEKQLDKLQSMLGAAVLSSALTGYASRRMA